MSAPADCDMSIKAPAVIEWQQDDETHRLSDPDPPDESLELNSQFDSRTLSAYFKLHLPVRLKGINVKTHILCVIHTDSITSLDCKMFPMAPEEVQKKLACGTFCLHFKLSRPMSVIIPEAATEPATPRKPGSGSVLDAARSLAMARTLIIYLPDKELPSKAHLQVLRDAVSQGQLRSLGRPGDLAPLYSGSGGRLLVPVDDDETASEEEPPFYHSIGSPPPTAPLTGASSKKRRRLDDNQSKDSTRSESNAEMILAQVVQMQERFEQRLTRRFGQKVKTLEDKLKILEGKVEELQEDLAVIKSNREEDTEQLELVKTDMLDLEANMQADLDQIGSDIAECHERIDDINANGLEEEVKDRIIQESTEQIVERISNRKYSMAISLRSESPN